MSRRRITILVLLVLCCFVGFVRLRLLRPDEPFPSDGNILQEMFEIIKVGMTIEQVQGILGSPGQIERKGYVRPDRELPADVYLWKNDGEQAAEIRVIFENGKVVEKESKKF